MSNDPVTIINPITGESWTSGKRGRKPKFVTDMEQNGLISVPRMVITKVKEAVQPLVPGALRVWKWIAQSGEEGNDEHQHTLPCFIVAQDAKEALLVANPTFIYPIGASELKLMWKELDSDMIKVISDSGVDVTKPAVWEGGKGKWLIRPHK